MCAGREVYLHENIHIKSIVMQGTLYCPNSARMLSLSWFTLHGTFSAGTQKR